MNMSVHENLLHERFLAKMEEKANSHGEADCIDNYVTVRSLDLMNLIRLVRGEKRHPLGFTRTIGSADYAGLRKVQDVAER